ncbi:lipopolysaccharide heptosyltransferase family protein [Bacteroidetes/Chlorobi group bacterium Naka2016]|jgi:ADP-heptose:LPS heptosyltransferase|nr:MAG: lipopolysaccharide heptosyltransferase family protein [Bacteroidetes/Chlorobi group bacterium Naka2016]
MQIMNFENTYSDIRSVAVVRTDRIGDIILTLPMCVGIKELLPNVKLTLIARRYVEPVLFKCQVVDNVVFIDDYENNFKTIFTNISPQVAFFPRPRFNEVYYAFKSNIPVRIGSAYRWYSFLFTHKIKEHRKIAKFNEARYNLRMVEKFFRRNLDLKYVKINVKPEAETKILEMLEILNIEKNNFVILHPGSGGSTITWPLFRFTELAQILIQTGNKVIITGSSQEIPLATEIQKMVPEVVNLTGRLDLYEMIALISLARGLVANSTGILHIASVLEIPTVGLFPNTPHLSAKRWGPIGLFSSTISPMTTNPEQFDDMSIITPDIVFLELQKQISKKEAK